MAVLISQLATGGINILSPATAQTYIDTVFLQVLHKGLYFGFFGFFKPGKIDWIVFNYIN